MNKKINLIGPIYKNKCLIEYIILLMPLNWIMSLITLLTLIPKVTCTVSNDSRGWGPGTINVEHQKLLSSAWNIRLLFPILSRTFEKLSTFPFFPTAHSNFTYSILHTFFDYKSHCTTFPYVCGFFCPQMTLHNIPGVSGKILLITWYL